MIADTFTVRQVAEKLQASEWWVRDQVKRGRVTPLRLGDSARAAMRFTDDDIDQLYTSLRPVEVIATQRRRRRRVS